MLQMRYSRLSALLLAAGLFLNQLSPVLAQAGSGIESTTESSTDNVNGQSDPDSASITVSEQENLALDTGVLVPEGITNFEDLPPGDPIVTNSELDQQERAIIVQFRLLEVTAIDETDPEDCLFWNCESDDIFLGAVASAHYGTDKIPYIDLGDFDDGTSRKWYDVPLVFYEFRLTDYPQTLAMKLILVEEDHTGGKAEFLEQGTNHLHNKVLSDVEAKVNGLHAADTNASDDFGSTVAAIKQVYDDYASQHVKAWWENLAESLRDDIFFPQVRRLYVSGPTFRWSGGNPTSAQTELRFIGYRGEYKLVYDWNIAPDNGQVVSADADETQAQNAPWENMRHRFPSYFWTPPHALTKDPSLKFTLTSAYNGQCLQSGPKVTSGNCTSSGQQWRFVPVGQYYQVVNQAEGLCLDMQAVPTFYVVTQTKCNSSDSGQLWMLRQTGSRYQILAAESSQCVDVYSTLFGVPIPMVHVKSCNALASNDQSWTVTQVKESNPAPTPAPTRPNKVFLPLIGK